MSIAVLHPAYVWDCEACGRENFQRAVSVRLDAADADDARTIRMMHDLGDADPIPPGSGVLMTTRPDRVTCRHCGEGFPAEDDTDANDEEADE